MYNIIFFLVTMYDHMLIFYFCTVLNVLVNICANKKHNENLWLMYIQAVKKWLTTTLVTYIGGAIFKNLIFSKNGTYYFLLYKLVDTQRKLNIIINNWLFN